MPAILYIVDSEFTRKFPIAFPEEFGQNTEGSFGEFYLVFRPDSLMNKTAIDWKTCVEHVLQIARSEAAPQIVVLGHKVVFREYIEPLDMYKAETRVHAAERELIQELGTPAPAVSVIGFHHVQWSETASLLAEPRVLAQPGIFARIRSIVEDGGGPIGRLSALKHEVMRPFASMRLEVQLDPGRGAGIAPEIVERFSSAVTDGKAKLADLENRFGVSRQFCDAIKEARVVFEEDVQHITADPLQFNQWIDRLNDALDQVRQEAR